MTSVYEWQGHVHEGHEVVVVFKTTEEMIPDLTAFITTRHPSDNPCVVALPLTGGSQKFLDWIASQVKDRRS
ncbi:MAG: divalent-cation tolerance protein CutA [Proteobacteria bacterium]|nr:divalent-cation tolerance protein CutA [Pseudomonadota bacterium]